MKLTLKNVRIHADMSEETTCFSATVYLDGVRAGHANNRGTGGPHDIDWSDRDLGAKYEAWLDSQVVPFTTYEGKLTTLDTVWEKLETMIDEALDAFEQEKWLKRQCKSKTLFKLKDKEAPEKPDEWWVIKAPFSEVAKHKLQKMYGDNLGEIANERFV